MDKWRNFVKHGNETFELHKMSVAASFPEDLLVLAFQGLLLGLFGYTCVAIGQEDFWLKLEIKDQYTDRSY